jgi:RNA polymerase sigma-70 factor (ECF subfamily)
LKDTIPRSNKLGPQSFTTMTSRSDLKKIEDIELITLAIAGNVQAFGEIYERHATAIYRYLYAHLSNVEDAEDLTEDVFLKVWRALPDYRDREYPFQAFLFRVARNSLIDHYRKAERSTNQVSIDTILVQDHQPGPFDQMMTKIEHAELQRLLGQLREDYRMVLVLRFLSDLSPEEAAGVMSRSAGAVRVLQHRALAALRELMDKEKVE